METRLKKQKDFDAVFNKGERVYTRSLTLLYLKSKEFKFGISLSKKHGKAHLRNRIKRIIRAGVREVIKDGVNPYYIVVLPKVREVYNFHELKNDILYSLKKGKVLSD
ncbi:MAG: ribonuclease P protein component [Clostridia bacterium]|nr:ribonuclease P protein component [Clostridia bacterium]